MRGSLPIAYGRFSGLFPAVCLVMVIELQRLIGRVLIRTKKRLYVGKIGSDRRAGRKNVRGGASPIYLIIFFNGWVRFLPISFITVYIVYISVAILRQGLYHFCDRVCRNFDTANLRGCRKIDTARYRIFLKKRELRKP